MKKILIAIVAILLVLNTFELLNTEGRKADEDYHTQIRFSWWGVNKQHIPTNEVIAMFEEDHPGVRVIPEYINEGLHFERLAAQLVAEEESDLIQVNFEWLSSLSEEGDRFYDLYEVESIDLNNWSQESLDKLTVNGKLQGVPISNVSRSFFINKTLYDEAGIEIPRTWEDLMAAGHIFQERLGEDYYALGNIDFYEDLATLTFSYLAQKTGNDIIEDGQIGFTVEELEEGFVFVNDLINNYVIPDVDFDVRRKDYENPNWISGHYGGIYIWNSSIDAYLGNLNPNIDANIVAVPMFELKEEQKHSGILTKYSSIFAISKNSNEPELAGELLNNMYTNEEAVKKIGLARSIPVNEEAKKILKNDGQLEGLEYEAYILAHNNDAQFLDKRFDDYTVNEAYNAVFDDFVKSRGKMSPQDAAEQLYEMVNVALLEAME
ncbi:oligogalacturonide transport system substrate-binding protein [Natranaerovirga hydrolytica]|uniref:Oligogalacturonide transport system substrate-binding protein n=1 Tax=Natranaerovirga hydrolytica TaxID=680378 RepID=A0A4V2Q1J6_9FIRM|nr:ABC transporter substrate-binding protein [Natranaerovirga hydrolytica]TCK97861.1 oligogalacturonide transport system substrate-binding protein [Natranaerovirga hydrolytica]